jgi:hypothetical protein
MTNEVVAKPTSNKRWQPTKEAVELIEARRAILAKLDRVYSEAKWFIDKWHGSAEVLDMHKAMADGLTRLVTGELALIDAELKKNGEEIDELLAKNLRRGHAVGV